MAQRILVYGTDGLAIPALHALLGDSSAKVVGVVTKPDMPAGRGHKLKQPAILGHVPEGIPVFQPKKLTSELCEQLTALKPDIGLVVVYGKIIPENFLAIPKHGTWNIHPSLLPKYRGPSPIVSPILNGDTTTGVSIMLLDNEMDHGPVFAQEEIVITERETTESLFAKLSNISGSLLLNTIRQVIEEGLQPVEQDHDAATYCTKFSKDDLQLDFSKSAEELDRLVRAFPGQVWFFLPNNKRCKVFSAHVTPQPTSKPVGSALCTKAECTITCGTDALVLDEVRVEGKSTMDAQTFANGYRSLFV